MKWKDRTTGETPFLSLVIVVLATMRPRRRLLIALGAAVIVPVLAAVLVALPPGESTYYPRCVFHMATGLHCPGCGATRCLSAVLKGDVRQAAAYNLVLLACLPLATVLLMYEGFTWTVGKTTRKLPWPAWSPYFLLALVILFGVLRNLPFEPFTWLAPHSLTP
jgi:uncharacterized protein DUF2752